MAEHAGDLEREALYPGNTYSDATGRDLLLRHGAAEAQGHERYFCIDCGKDNPADRKFALCHACAKLKGFASEEVTPTIRKQGSHTRLRAFMTGAPAQ